MHVKNLHNWHFPHRLTGTALWTPAESRQWERLNICALAVLSLLPILLSLIALLTDWDLTLADAAFDVRSNTFPMRHEWLAEVFNHVILKRVFSVVGAGFILAAAWDGLSLRAWGRLRRLQIRIVAFSAVLVPLATDFLKRMSDAHCPWDLKRYGGTEAYFRLFDHFPAAAMPGHCMPAGHASSALWLMSIAIFFIPQHLKRAVAVLWIFLLIGFGVGWIQQLRGAHFLTHTLWSIWVSLAVIYLIIVCVDRWPESRLPKS